MSDINHLVFLICFGLLGGTALGGALGLLTTRHPLHGALYLIGVMASLAGLYLLLDSPFLGVLQILVYAGAIMMLVVFVIMVLNRAKDDEARRPDILSLLGALVPVALAALIVPQLAGTGLATRHGEAYRGEVPAIAEHLFRTEGGQGYWLLFQLIGVLLLVAIVAAVLLAKRTLDTPADADAAKDDHAAHH
jgi:NADH-quinone oxidoreductase subunit J